MLVKNMNQADTIAEIKKTLEDITTHYIRGYNKIQELMETINKKK